MPTILVRLAQRMPTGIPIAGLASNQEAYLRLAADATKEGLIFLLEVKNPFHVPTTLVRERLLRLKEEPGEPPVDQPNACCKRRRTIEEQLLAFQWIAEPPPHALVFEVFPIVLSMRANVRPGHLSSGLAQLH